MARPSASEKPLARYAEKRNFKRTAEPGGVAPRRRSAKPKALAFVIQKHWASRLHYDFRLELDGVLLSWAVPKGPSFDPAVKHMAIQVEDHPLAYADFEGRIPAGEYGAGTVIVWDRGSWEPVGDAHEGLEKGKLIFTLHGEKLAGLWELVRISKPDAKKAQWLLLKKRGDAWARPLAEYDVISALPDSVIEKPLGPVEEREARAAPAEPIARRARRAAADPPDLSRAVKAALPEQLEPQLATLVAEAPAGGPWVVENKFDGYRLLAQVRQGRVRLLTRRGNEWTAKLPELAAAIEALALDDAWLDGEIVVLDENGVPDFNRLQNAIDNARSKDIVYFVFDLPFLGDRDLRQVPLVARRAVLADLLGGRAGERVRLSEAFDATPGEVLEAACRIGLEGVILKRADAPYVSARSDTWLKLKCQQRQEFVVVGYTERTNAPAEVGNLLLGYYEDGKLHYAGALGTGWSARESRELRARLHPLKVAEPPIDPDLARPGRWSRRTGGARHWLRPEVVVEVVFGEWTPDGHIRHASYRGVRLDKPASAVTRERPQPPQGAQGAQPRRPLRPARAATGAPLGAARVTSVKVSNPERVIDPSTGVTKLQLVRYYESIAPWMLPHLKDRPVSLVRAPEGIAGEQFFQKHAEIRIPNITELDAALWPGHSALLAIDSAEALVAAAQMNSVEFHTWNAKVRRINEPDRMVFDLDPGEGVSWAQLQEAAQLMRTLLDELGLASWLKTSGGKGLHVVVPIAAKLGFDAVKGFSQAIVQHMAKTIPQRFVAKSGGANRVGKIFIDYLRNGHGQTTVAAFSARARPGLGVSMPIAWEQLPALKSAAQWTIATAREYLSFQQDDPWAAYWKSRQSLTRAMKALGYTP